MTTLPAMTTTQAAATTTMQAALDVCEVAPTPGLTAVAVEVDGRAYPAEIYQPERRDAAPAAAVIDLHGLDSSGPAQAALTRFRELADREGFVVAEPSGPVGPLGVTGWKIAAVDEPGRDDVGAIDQLIDILLDDHCVDPELIFVAGYSNGGFLAAELACRPGSRVAAIVAVAGFHAPEQCERHVPTLAVHGTADPIVPLGPNGMSLIVDDTTPPSLAELLAASIEQEVAMSASGAGCDNQPTSTELADDITELSYDGCDDGANHKLVLVEGGGHTWPGAATTADEAFLGPTTANFDATEAGWAFFASYSKPS
jgi:polyhydroxybutyrate depolymerase